MSDVVEKWGLPVAERGFTQIPNYLLNLNRFLDDEHRLSPVELLVVFHLVGGWWRKAEMPFPSIATLAVRCGVSARQVQRAVTNLDKRKIIGRVKRKERGIVSSNAYDLTPLVEFLNIIAKHYPNEYPRRVTREDRLAIIERSNLRKEVGKNEGGDDL